MKRFAFIVIAAVVIGCSSTPPPPDWAVNAQGALERSVSAYLAGNTRVAALDLARARAEVARDAEVQAIIAADRSVDYGVVMDVVDTIKLNGVTTFALNIDLDEAAQP